MFGICNNENDALNECLKQLALETKKNALQDKKTKKEIIELKWREIEIEENPEQDKVLQELIRREKERKK